MLLISKDLHPYSSWNIINLTKICQSKTDIFHLYVFRKLISENKLFDYSTSILRVYDIRLCLKQNLRITITRRSECFITTVLESLFVAFRWVAELLAYLSLKNGPLSWGMGSSDQWNLQLRYTSGW